MKSLTAAEVARLGAYKDIVDALREGFLAFTSSLRPGGQAP